MASARKLLFFRPNPRTPTPHNMNTLLRIDRSRPLDLQKLLRILDNRSLNRICSQNKDSISREGFDPETVLFDTGQRGHGDERPWIPLDAGAFLTLWEDKSQIPESWKRERGAKARFPEGDRNIVIFCGTTLESSAGVLYFIYIAWDEVSANWVVGNISTLSMLDDGGKSECPCFEE